MAIWLHPSVTSTIVDNSGFYATADGVTTLFAPGFFEKGKDNELIAIDGPTDAELVKKFGKIDAVEYGQNHLNLVNWLTAGGSAIVMRCLPDNAKYAHAILEVLTRKVTVKVNKFTPEGSQKSYDIKRKYDSDGNFIGYFYINDNDEKITISEEDATILSAESNTEDTENTESNNTKSTKESETEIVSVIPKISYVPSGVSKKGTIEGYIKNKNGQKNADGYTRHILGYFIPDGRGAEFYNDTRINISLATNYDNTYDFRVYSLYIEKHDKENDEWGIIYGPFYVSFDETSRDISDESMFIADVLDKYCEEFKFIPIGESSDEDSGEYNSGFYAAAKAIAGENAPLRRVDVLSGQEYYDEANEEFSSIHNCLVNGGSYSLSKDLTTDDNGGKTIYINEKNLPAPLSYVSINGESYQVIKINTTTNEVTLDKAVIGSAYEEEDLKNFDDNEREELEKIILLKNSVVIYKDIVNNTSNTVKVLMNDNAILPVQYNPNYKKYFEGDKGTLSLKYYKFLLEKNSIDFVKGMNVSVDLTETLTGDNEETTFPSTLDLTFSDNDEIGPHTRLLSEDSHILYLKAADTTGKTFANTTPIARFDTFARATGGLLEIWNKIAYISSSNELDSKATGFNIQKLFPSSATNLKCFIRSEDVNQSTYSISQIVVAISEGTIPNLNIIGNGKIVTDETKPSGFKYVSYDSGANPPVVYQDGDIKADLFVKSNELVNNIDPSVSNGSTTTVKYEIFRRSDSGTIDNNTILILQTRHVQYSDNTYKYAFAIFLIKMDYYTASYSVQNFYRTSASYDLICSSDSDKTIHADYDSTIETSYTGTYLRNILGKVVDIDDVDDTITIGFNRNNTANAKYINHINNLDKYDYAHFVGGIENSLSDGGTSDNIVISEIGSPINDYSKFLSLSENDNILMKYGSAGDVDTASGATRAEVAKTRKNLLIEAFRGNLNPAVTMKKFWPFDIVLDANYDVSIKNVINDLTSSREDFMFLCDTGFCATPEQAINKRNNDIVYNNRYTAIFTQDMRVYDEYTGKNIKVTPTYFLAKKIPYVDRAYGIHYAFVGPNRGEVEGMIGGTLSWNPTEAQKEKLYKKQLNYIQNDPNHLMFMGQLTSQKRSSSLSDIPNVRALLMIRRNIENICEEYYFERINDNLLNVMSSACNNYLGQWISNGTLSEGNVSVYASEYDMKQKLVRVQVEMKFTSFLERVVITFTVK